MLPTERAAGTLALSILLIVGIAGPASLVNRTTLTGGRASSCSLVEQIGLALNTTTPLVKTGSQQACLIDTTAAGQFVIAGSWVLQALGWAFVTLFIADSLSSCGNTPETVIGENVLYRGSSERARNW